MTTALGALAALTVGGGAAQAADLVDGGKLLLTGGVSTIEGSAGGGLSSWAVIAGNETDAGIGGKGHVTVVDAGDYRLTGYGVAIGFYDRVELSYARQEFNTQDVGAKLGLGKGFTFKQDIVGAKVRILGDAVYDQDRMMPQISVGAQWKSNDRGAIVRAVGAKDDQGLDLYVAATKIVLDRSLVLSGTVRATKANQGGLLGFGGPGKDDYSAQFEGSAGYLINRKLVVGGEYRTKPSNLAFAKEDDWFDLFAAYAVNHTVSVTGAYVDLGDIATFKNQRGVYLSLQAAF